MRAAWLLCLVAALDSSAVEAQGQRVGVEWREGDRERTSFEVHNFRYSADAYTQTQPTIELLTPSGNVFVPYSKIGSIDFLACSGRGATHDQAARWDVTVHLVSGSTRTGAVDLRYLLGTDQDGLEWRLWMGHPCTRDAKALRRLVFSP
jgi:hypothetical protein